MSEPASPRTAKVLVVDDDAIVRELLRLHLSNHGYQVFLAEDAVVGGKLLLSEHPDLAIVDVQMPYMNGYEFVEVLKSDPTTRNTPIIFLTSDEDVRDESRRLGAAAYLQQPVRADRLLEVVSMFA